MPPFARRARCLSLIAGTLSLSAAIAGAAPPRIDYQEYPHLVAQVEDRGNRQLALHDDLVYAATSTGLEIWDFADPSAPRLTGDLFVNRPLAVIRIVGDLAYVLDGNGRLLILDLAVSATQPPTLCDLAAVPGFGSSQDLVVQGTWLYSLGHYGGVYTVDVSNPRAPRRTSVFNPHPNSYTALAVEGNLLCVSAWQDVVLADISNPARPVFWADLVTPGNAGDMIIRDGTLFLDDYHRGLLIADVRQPSQPIVLSHLEREGYYADGLLLDGDTLISGNDHDGFVIIDVADLLQPRIVCAFGGISPQTFVRMGRHLVAAVYLGLQVFDLANMRPVPMNAVMPFIREAGDITVRGNQAFVAGSGQIMRLDLSGPGTPVWLDPVSIPRETVRGIAVTSRHLYATAGYDGLYVFDCKHHGPAQQTGRLRVNDRSLGAIDVSDDVAVVAARSWVVFVDISDPSRPVLISQLDVPSVVEGLVTNGSLAYVASGYGGLLVVDFSQPANPVILAALEPGELTTGIAWRAPCIYVSWQWGLRIYDASDPRLPVLLSDLSLPAHPLKPVLHGPVAYLPTERQGLQVVSVEDPYRPKILGGFDPLTWSMHAAAGQGRLYLAADDSFYIAPLQQGLHLESPDPHLIVERTSAGVQLAWTLEAGHRAQSIRILAEGAGPSRELPFTESATSGMITGRATDLPPGDGLVQYALQTRETGGEWRELDRAVIGGPGEAPQPIRVAIVPNPANPRAELRLELGEGGPVRVEIYDIAGRRIRRLVQGQMPAGSSRLTWDGCDDGGLPVASGAYFARTAAAGTLVTSRLQLVR